MALFKSAAELYQDGEYELKRNGTTTALKLFSKSYDAGFFDALLKMFEIHWNNGDTIKAIALVSDELNKDKLKDAERVKIANMLFNYTREKSYLSIGIATGDIACLEKMFDCCASDFSSTDELLKYGEKILYNSNISDRVKEKVYATFLDKIPCSVQKGRGYFVNVNSRLTDTEQYTYENILLSLIALKGIEQKRKEKYIMDLVRYYIVHSFTELPGENNNIIYSESYRIEPLGDVISLLKRLPQQNKLAQYYLTILHAFNFGPKTKKDLNTALSYCSYFNSGMNSKLGNDTEAGIKYFNYLYNNDDILYLRKLLNKNLNDGKIDNSKIIGNYPYKREIRSTIDMIDLQYNSWNRTSDFKKNWLQKRSLDNNIWIFDGEPNTLKRTCAFNFTQVMSSQLLLEGELFEINRFVISSIPSVSGKVDYVQRMLESLKEHKLYVIYFDSPDQIETTNDGRDCVKAILQAIEKKINDFKNGQIVLILAGDGDSIKTHLNNARIYKHKYRTIPFNGYSAEEAVELIHMINNSPEYNNFKIDLPAETINHIKQLIELKNNNSGKNIDYELVRYIYITLRRCFFDAKTNGESITYYTFSSAVEAIEKELGVQQKEDADFNEIMKDLDNLTGLKNIKSEMRKIISHVRINEQRRKAGLKTIDNSLHMVFAGNPGTGKTTVAKMMGKILKELGVLPKGHVVEVSRSDLVSNYFGATAGKTREVLKRALGGVLFIDEAYTLSNNSGSGNIKDYGIEAIEEILKYMSDHNTEICVIVAGYTENMKAFINTNPGLQSRFNKWIMFEDYSENELYSIFNKLCEKHEYVVEEEAIPYIVAEFKSAKAQGVNFGNARYVNNYFNELYSRLGDKLSQKYSYDSGAEPTFEELTTFTKDLFTTEAKEISFVDLFS